MDNRSADPRIPQDHGTAHQTNEVVDLGGPVARITRTTYVYQEWTRVTVMVPPLPEHGVPMQSLDITLNAKELALFVERLAWPK